VIVSRRSLGVLAAGALITSAFGVWFAVVPRTTAIAHFADADEHGMVRLGRQIYMGHCASCHGRNLQGQPLWQLIDEHVGRRAPAHDETGHTWQHSDEDIFHMIKYGRFPSAPTGAISFMPPARGRAERWRNPARNGFYQSSLADRLAGFPGDAQSRPCWNATSGK